MLQKTFDEKSDDDFVKLLNLTDEKIINDLESMRNIDGFPIGDIDDILELSNPPYYTAYPNPYIKKFIEYYGTPYNEKTDKYNIEPFVGDVREGKNDPIYRAHSYHTKVPPKAVMKFINHYTNENDIVLDGFCGSGMTGIASQILNRNVILLDLAVAAGFISFNYNKLSKKMVTGLFNNWKSELEKYYYTTDENGQKVSINYIVWSDVFSCPFCGNELVFWDVALNEDKTKNLKKFNCPHCDAQLSKNNLNRIFVDVKDSLLNKTVSVSKQIPVRVYYKKKNKSFFKEVDEFDLKLINEFEEIVLPFWCPLNKIPDGYNTKQAKKSHGIQYINQYYFNRELYVLSFIFDKITKIKDKELKMFFKWVFTSVNPRLTSKLARFRPGRGKSDAMSGILYTPSFQVEYNVLTAFESKLNKLSELFLNHSNCICSTQSSTDIKNIPDNSIDYIFIDPPFGSNLMYSELNFIWESWLKVFTNNYSEAIINPVQNKESIDYKNLLIKCFTNFFRILKPNRWITVEFHNSKAEIWNIIRESIVKSGFIIAQVAILDKKQGSFKQVTSPGAVKNDLVINAYKPSEIFSHSFKKNYGMNLEVEFIEMHLNKLPIEPNIERSEQMLYSKYLAQYLQNNFEVRLDSTDFNEILNNNFVERDGFWFTQLQTIKYDNKKDIKEKLDNVDITQSILGISDEKTALIWLTQFLKEEKSYDEIYKEYIKMLLVSQDKIPELKELLSENFVSSNGKYKIPSAIEKSQVKEVRVKKLDKDFKLLLSELENSNSKVKLVRKEALIYGLTKLYKEKNVDLIKFISNKLDNKIIDSDDDIFAIINWAEYM